MNLLQILKDSINTLYVRYIGNDEIENLPIYYIGGSQTLPPPLSNEEEADMLERLSNGEEEIRQILVERNLRLVVYIAKNLRIQVLG